MAAMPPPARADDGRLSRRPLGLEQVPGDGRDRRAQFRAEIGEHRQDRAGPSNAGKGDRVVQHVDQAVAGAQGFQRLDDRLQPPDGGIVAALQGLQNRLPSKAQAPA